MSSAASQGPANAEVVAPDLDKTILAKFNELAIIAHAKMATGNNERTRALPGLDSLPDLEGDNAEAMTGFLVEMGKSAVEFFRANPNGDFLAFRGWAKGKKQWSIKVEGMFNRYSPNKVEKVLRVKLPEFFETIRGDKRVLEAFNETAAQAAYESALAQYGAAARSGQLADQLPQLHLDFEKTAREQSEMMGYFWGNVAMLAGQFLAKKPQGNAQEFLKWAHKHGGKTGYNIAQAFGTQSKTPTGMFIRENLSDYFVAIREANAFFKGIDADISNKKEPEGILDKIGGFFTGMYDGFQEKSLGGKLFVVGMTVGFIYMAKELFSDGEGDGGGGLFSGMLGKMFGVSIAGAGLMSAIMGGPEKLAAYLKSNPEKRKEIMESGLLDLFFPGLGGKIEEGINFFSGENGDMSVGAGLENGTDVLAEQIYMGLQGISGKVAEGMEAIGITGFEDPVPTRAEMNAYFNTTEGQQFLKENKELLLAGGGVALAVAGYALWKPAKFLGLLGSIATAPIEITKRLIGLNVGRIAFGTAVIAGMFLLFGGIGQAKAAELAEDFRQRHRSSLPPWVQEKFDKILTGDFDLHEALNATEANALQDSLAALGKLPPEAEKYRAEMLGDLARRDEHGNSDTNLDDFLFLARAMGVDPENLRQEEGAWYFQLGGVAFGPLPENPFDMDGIDMARYAMEVAWEKVEEIVSDLANVFEKDKLTSLAGVGGLADSLKNTHAEIQAAFSKDNFKQYWNNSIAKDSQMLELVQQKPVEYASLVAVPAMGLLFLKGRLSGLVSVRSAYAGLALMGLSAYAYYNLDEINRQLVHEIFGGLMDFFQKHVADPVATMAHKFDASVVARVLPDGAMEMLRDIGFLVPDVWPNDAETAAMFSSLAELESQMLSSDVNNKIEEIRKQLAKDPPRFDSVLFQELAFRAQRAGAGVAVEGSAPPYTLIIGRAPAGRLFWEDATDQDIEDGIRFAGLQQNPLPEQPLSDEELELEMTFQTIEGLVTGLGIVQSAEASDSTDSTRQEKLEILRGKILEIMQVVEAGGHAAFDAQMEQELIAACEAAGISCEREGAEILIAGATTAVASGTQPKTWLNARDTFGENSLEALIGGTWGAGAKASADAFGLMLNFVDEGSALHESMLEFMGNPNVINLSSFWYTMFTNWDADENIAWQIGKRGLGIIVGGGAFIFSAWNQTTMGAIEMALRAMPGGEEFSLRDAMHEAGGALIISGAIGAAGGTAFGGVRGIFKEPGIRKGAGRGFIIGGKIGIFPVSMAWEGIKRVPILVASKPAFTENMRGILLGAQSRTPILRTKTSFIKLYISLKMEHAHLTGAIKGRMPGIAARKGFIEGAIDDLGMRFARSPFSGTGKMEAKDRLADEAIRWQEEQWQALRNKKAAYLRKKRAEFRDAAKREADKYLRSLSDKIAEYETTLKVLQTENQSIKSPNWRSKFREFFSSPTPPGFVPASQAGFAGPRPDADTANPPEGHADADASKQRGGGFGAKAASSEQPASQSAAEPEPRPGDAPEEGGQKSNTSQRPEVEGSNVRSGKNAKAAVPSHWKAWTPPSASQVRRRIDGAESYEPNSINNQADAPAGRTPDTGLEQPSSAGKTPPVSEKISTPESTSTDPDARTEPPKPDNPPPAARNQQSIDTSDPLTDEQIREIYGRGSSSVSIPGTPAPEAPAALVHEPEQQPRLTPQQKVDAEAERIIQEKKLNTQQASHLRRAARGLLHVMGPASVVLFLHEVSNAKDPREVFALDAVTFASGTAVSVGLAMTGLGLPVSIPAGIVTSLGVAFFGYDPIAKFFEERRARAGEQERGRQYQQDSQSMQNIVRIAPIEKLASSVFAGDTALAHFGETHLQRVGHMNGWGQFQVQEGIDASTLAHGLADTSGKAEIFTREASAETIAQWNKEIRQQIAEAEAKAAKLPRQLQHLANKQLSRAELYAKANAIMGMPRGGPGQSGETHPQFITIYNAYLAAREAVELQAEIIDEQNEAFAKKYADQIMKLSMQVARWEEDNQAKRRPEFFHAAGELIQAMRTLERIGMWQVVAKQIDASNGPGAAQKMRDYARKLFAERRKYLQDMDRDLSSGFEADGA